MVVNRVLMRPPDDARARRCASPCDRARRPCECALRMLSRAVRMHVLVQLVLARRCAALAVDPSGIAVFVVLLLPDGNAVFHFIDDVAARAKRLVAVARARAHPHRHIADPEIANAVHAGRALDAEALDRLGYDPLAFLHRQRLERLVLQVPNLVPFVVIAHPAFERRIPAALRIRELGAKRGGVDRRMAEAKNTHGTKSSSERKGGSQPPATGGMNTTASPSASCCDQSPNSVLTATRSISGASENG